MFKPVSNKVAFPKMEEEVLAFWEKDGTFKKSLKKNEGKERYKFYDGPLRKILPSALCFAKMPTGNLSSLSSVTTPSPWAWPPIRRPPTRRKNCDVICLILRN